MPVSPVLRRNGGIACFGLIFLSLINLPSVASPVAKNREAVDSTNGVTFRAVIKDGSTTVTRTGKDNRTVRIDPARLSAKEALLVAILLDDQSRAKALLDKDPSLANSRDASGTTPLHQAAFHGDATIVKLLLVHGAKVNAKNAAGTTALELVTDDATRAVLKKYGAK